MERAARRPRLWLRLALTAIALAVSARIAWHFRPLSAAERKLVGNWSIYTNPVWGRGITYKSFPVDGAVLKPDRRFSIHVDCQSTLRPGSWRVAGDQLFLRYDVPFDLATFPQRLIGLVGGTTRWEQFDIDFKQPGVIRTHRGGQDKNTWLRYEPSGLVGSSQGVPRN